MKALTGGRESWEESWFQSTSRVGPLFPTELGSDPPLRPAEHSTNPGAGGISWRRNRRTFPLRRISCSTRLEASHWPCSDQSAASYSPRAEHRLGNSSPLDSESMTSPPGGRDSCPLARFAT
ncbi:Hypothetical protein NTJ_05522 [Nesidiocoris tenuis]|uniref:Uncharacterized protein n=1 Tax=Nesidiocoris tenuis TaxID=355587 RepID=A0ABN7AKD3_9HEMI|nr:Hypothetical protein NTJ_05522 [Nesidiocoris tenuis]